MSMHAPVIRRQPVQSHYNCYSTYQAVHDNCIWLLLSNVPGGAL